MKLIVDMNLSPSWVGWLTQRGFETVHWSTIGAATAPDDEIMSWARAHGFVVLTNDLDFSAILAATSDRSPSVVQLRAQDLLSESAVGVVANSLEVYRVSIDQGALLSIDESGARIRMLPLPRFSDEP